MGQGDTDAIDSNGDIVINDGTININAQSPFDYDGEAKYKGGIIIVNGKATNKITNQMMGMPGSHDKKERKQILDSLVNETRTIIIYEAPHHLLNTLKELSSYLGNRRITICKELTKLHEKAMYGYIDEFINKYETDAPKGEFVLVIEGKEFSEICEEERKKWENPEEIQKLNIKMQAVAKLCALPDKTFSGVIQFCSL